ncbi:hypothetical protein RDI58_019138 [Solanum bulbocastanum]|uniref:Uncharacterized protein n=1 Tax=Solanum bulbocastanum TaxID=147425 RepID=A0AAN8YDQ2_SOLBU
MVCLLLCIVMAIYCGTLPHMNKHYFLILNFDKLTKMHSLALMDLDMTRLVMTIRFLRLTMTVVMILDHAVISSR